MKREGSDEPSGRLEYELPATKPSHEFKGDGLEIVGEPHKISGELRYQDGRCTGVSAASPAFEDLPPSKRRAISDGKFAAWFNLERKHKLENPPSDADTATTRHQELEAKDTAARLAGAFAEAMLKGELMALIRDVEEEYGREAKRFQARRDRNKADDGIHDALSAIALGSTHPDQVTLSAIVDFLRAEENKEFCKAYGGFSESMKSHREVRKRLEKIGFGWIGQGRPQGRPSSNL